MNAPELEKKVNISIGLLLGLVVGSFTIGGLVTRIVSQEKEMMELHQFAIEEVEGLRSDWERRYKDNINPRLTKLENGKSSD
jgi:hypothetical protein